MRKIEEKMDKIKEIEKFYILMRFFYKIFFFIIIKFNYKIKERQLNRFNKTPKQTLFKKKLNLLMQ